MVKTYVLDQLLAEWFIKSLLPPITEDVAKGGVITEEKFIAHAQYLDLVYTQSGTLYDKIPDAPRPEFSIPPPPKSNNDSRAGNGMFGKHKISSQNANEELLASEVNSMSTDKGKPLKRPGGKKKKIGRKRKPPAGCHICDEDHWTKDCPHIAEVKKLFKSSKTPAVLTDPFPNPGQNLVANQNAS